MTISLKTIMDNLPPEQRARVEKRAAELIAEEMTLQDLRKAREFTLSISPRRRTLRH
jgi:hypothetical protein